VRSHEGSPSRGHGSWPAESAIVLIVFNINAKKIDAPQKLLSIYTAGVSSCRHLAEFDRRGALRSKKKRAGVSIHQAAVRKRAASASKHRA
jgi:hypothetical protein